GEEVLRRADLDVDVAARGDEGAVVPDDEGAVELGELLDGLAELGALDVQEVLRVPVEGVEEQRARLRQDAVHVADDEEGADLASLAPFTGELDGEVDDALEGPAPLLGAVRAAANRTVRGLEELRLGVHGHPLGRTAV